MSDKQDIERLEDILDMIAKMASLDFSTELPISGNQDMIDAISLGLNMLGEELNVQVVARARLDELNEKLEKFAYTTAHDLKSPLNSQSGLFNILEHTINFDNNPETKEIVDRLKLMNEKMQNLVFEILEYSRLN
jgi:signal transduction histidine kinase